MSNHRGSALLIVLGMLSFMVVSSVAFSMFMRQSRLPSSFLRQRLTASQLVKAGLAGAMQRIDAAIGDNPYPGVGDAGLRQVRFKHKDGSESGIDYGNFWHNRVFMESRLAKDSVGDDDETNLDFDPVATLTLEALAYLPPPLVNTVRYWSKRTTTASWQSLGYDAGRYAFTAVNVSDYFDINRLPASCMRDSSAARRISIGYLFENSDHTGEGAASPQAFDTFMQQVTNDTFRTRLVSMADYNLAIGSGSYGSIGFRSPFWDYFQQGGGKSDGSFYNGDYDNARAQKFITDSWYPGTNTTGLVLTDDAAQPLEGLDTGLDPLMKNAGEGFNEIKKHLNLAERAALVDYLDEDNLPTSLALPTAERTPMLTGLQIVPFDLSPTFEVKEIEGEVIPATATTPADKWMYRVWSLKNLGDAKIMFGGSAVYPFKRTSGLSEANGYDVQVLVKMFVSLESEDFSETRSDISYRPTSKDWSGINSDMNTAVWAFHGVGRIAVTHGTSENGALCAIQPSQISIDMGTFPNQVFAVKYRQSDPTQFTPDKTKIDNPLVYRTKGGDVKRISDLDFANFPDLKVNFFAWVRVLDGNNTVDLVPAQIKDDQLYNGFAVPGVQTELLGEARREPVLPFAGPKFDISTATFTPAKENFATPAVTLEGLRIYCNDPRYNWAPEDWYSAGDGATISANGWLTEIESQLNGADCRPHDIFQFVSNEGYLQSMGELQFLPLVRRNYGDFTLNSAVGGSFFNTGRYDGKAFSQRNGLSTLANREYMWKTRWAFGDHADWRSGDDHDPYAWGIQDTNGGPAVNPHAERDLLMAAFANTPYDWIVASENDPKTLSEGRRYCFSPASSEAKVDWKEMETLAQNFKNELAKANDSREWTQKYRDADGWDSGDGLFGADFGNDFHDVDRKFLFGYWRSCFANTPQLFLVFVRAEPAVMGGSSAGHTPSQLGARAVALVWREATSTIRDQQSAGNGQATYPHRMRILFYHQFE